MFIFGFAYGWAEGGLDSSGEFLTYNGEPITYNGQIITTMAELIEILDKRTVTATLLADADLTVDGTMVAGAALDPSEPVTALTSRGASIYDSDGREIKNFSYGTGTQVIVQSDGEEREIKITYNI